MNKLLIVFDLFNNRWLQNSEEGGLQWTDIPAQCSFYELERKEELLRDIKKLADGEVWIEFREIYVNLDEQQ